MSSRDVKLFLHQVRGEQLLYWRTREAAIFTFAFPILLFVLVDGWTLVVTSLLQSFHP